MSEGAYLYLRVPNAVFGCLLVFEGSYWCVSVLMGV